MDVYLGKRYRVQHYPGIAWRIVGWASEGFVQAVMIGDNREFTIDIDDLAEIQNDEYCHCCGQIGCGW